jgi:hypothetical protein
MKPCLLFISIVLLFIGCKSSTWEYKILKVQGTDTLSREGYDAFKGNFILPSELELNKLGKEGWELISAESEVETAFPNFGKEEYVTGLQPNVRSSGLVLIFKREAKK